MNGAPAHASGVHEELGTLSEGPTRALGAFAGALDAVVGCKGQRQGYPLDE